MNLRALFRRRDPAASAPAPEAIVPAGPPPITCAEAGRGGYIVRHDRERAKIRTTTIALAEKIGRPELAERLR
jgi:hypothetical protein